MYPYQDRPDGIQVWTDTDRAGCRTTRKSTSGGVLLWGSHCIKTWSVTQGYIALSSGEAEYCGAVRGASQAIGIRAMLQDLGVQADVAIMVDASAAVGITMRRGLGKIRHIELNELWLQDQVARGRVTMHKIDGKDNFSDSLTKHSNPERIKQTMDGTLQRIVPGRHSIMPNVAQ